VPKKAFAVVVSREDSAGMNIASFLEGKLPSNMELHFIEDNQCFANYVEDVSADFFVFASMHKSASEKPTLTVHAPGNWGKAELGGKEKELVPTNSFLIKNYLLGLEKQRDALNLDYSVALECSHHGPFLTKPAVFIELGSCKEQWKDRTAANAVANTIIECTSLEGNFKSAIAVGGGHYCPEFTKLVLRTEWALGHICPLYALENFNEKLLGKSLTSTNPKPEAIILDWKGLKGEKKRVVELAENSGIGVFKARNLLK